MDTIVEVAIFIAAFGGFYGGVKAIVEVRGYIISRKAFHYLKERDPGHPIK